MIGLKLIGSDGLAGRRRFFLFSMSNPFAGWSGGEQLMGNENCQVDLDAAGQVET